jgi:hypothetical protein
MGNIELFHILELVFDESFIFFTDSPIALIRNLFLLVGDVSVLTVAVHLIGNTKRNWKTMIVFMIFQFLAIMHPSS